jgi:serine/threonine protein kinase
MSSCEPVEKWLQSGRNAWIGPLRLKPVEHTYAKGKPLSSQKGQAEAFFLIDEYRKWWILKKFRQACRLDSRYLTRVASLLPRQPGFVCGTNRQILTSGSLQKAKDTHYSKDLDRWLDGTILMPRVKGVDWACLADDARNGDIVLEPPQRLALCRRLTQLVELLEAHRCSHRDLSCGNIFIDIANCDIVLIDFDSLFHPSLIMPTATTCGTAGYTAAYMWTKGNLDARRSWCESADRYALAMLNVEMLLVSKGTPATGEGGIFDQDELRNGSGHGIDSALAQLKTRYPQAATLLLQAIRSQTPADCPAPRAWNNLFQGVLDGPVDLPRLADLMNPANRISELLARTRPAAPLWPAPRLQEMPVRIPQIPKTPNVPPQIVYLPPEPWANNQTKGGNTYGRPKP